MTDREQLRDRMAEASYSARWLGYWSHVEGVERELELQVIDAILAEIEAAGYVLVERRYLTFHTCREDGYRWECIKPGGKLDPLDGGE